ncbi:MAG TPA: hypothetical protein VG345_09200 [Bryobacteraceae bacterium]|nr:hypothetical protein [Bryobacteraceae bacterium]
MADRKMTLGLIVGNRGFFPDHLARSGREDMLGVLANNGVDVVAPGEADAIAEDDYQTKHGAVETRREAVRCADLFRRNRDRIDGMVVTLPGSGNV